MLRRSKIFVGIGSKFATSSAGAKSSGRRYGKGLVSQPFNGWERFRYAAPTELAVHLVPSAIKIYLLRRIELFGSVPMDVSTAFEVSLASEPRCGFGIGKGD